jgi:uncharacterized protein YbaP (TraB family)
MGIFGKLKHLGYWGAFAVALGLAQDANAAKARHAPVSEAKHAKAADSPHPALFRIANARSTVYFLGSVHVLPQQYEWRSPEIDKAMAASDVFLFEANVDFFSSEFDYYRRQHGYLPRGETIYKLLPPDAQKKYVDLIRAAGIDPNKLDYLKPGLAVLMLQDVGSPTGMRIQPGVDSAVERYAKEHGKPLAYLETLQSQFDLLTTLGGGTQVEMLEKLLTEKSKENGTEQFKKMLAAWTKGDLKTLRSFDDEQETLLRPLLLDKRNANWIPRINSLLGTPGTFFVTVGARHLTGANSVIDLACRKGWKVERIEPGNAPPEPACPAVATADNSAHS